MKSVITTTTRCHGESWTKTIHTIDVDTSTWVPWQCH